MDNNFTLRQSKTYCKQMWAEQFIETLKSNLRDAVLAVQSLTFCQYCWS